MYTNRKHRWLQKTFPLGLVAILVSLAAAPPGIAAPAAAPSPEDLGDLWQLPFVRFGHSAVLDYHNSRMIVFGGTNGQQFFNDVWALDPTLGEEAWTKLDPDGAWPPPRGMHSAIYDYENERMIVFGGRGFHYNFDDVWALDLSTPGAESWSMLQPDGPAIPARRWHTAIYDRAGNRMLVFGGGGSGGLMNDVWALSLTPGEEAWSEVPVTGSVPDARWQHTAINTIQGSVPNQGRMIVFGGMTSGGTPVNDTWELDLETSHWTELAVGPNKPSARRGHTAVLAPGYSEVLLFGGQGASGFLNDLWKFEFGPGENEWSELHPTGGPPGTRAWHAAVYWPTYSRMFLAGGRGMGSLAGETQWWFNQGGVHWEPLWPTLPPWWGGGGGVLAGNRPDVTLQIEDAAPNQSVNLLSDSQLETYFVVKLFTISATFKDDVDVTISLPESKFDKESVRAGTRAYSALEPSTWVEPQYQPSGLFRLNNVDLVPISGGYGIQVVFRANVISAATGSASITARARGTNWQATLDSSATARFYPDPQAWIVTSRKGLFHDYWDSEAETLLQDLYSKGYSRQAVVIYPDRYLDPLESWDNTTVNYANEETANEVADIVATWLSSRYSVRYPSYTHAYPDYMAIIGDDNVIPFYRQYDESGTPENREPDADDPVIEALVSHNFFFTDNLYGDEWYSSGSDDWEEGELDAAVGRVVGASAADMSRMVLNATLGPRTEAGRALIASVVGMDWWLPGTDIVSVIMNDLDYTVNTALIDDSATKTQVVDEMRLGITAMALAGHGSERGMNVAAPGDDWPPGEIGIIAQELPTYDDTNGISVNRIFYQFVSCRTGFSHSTAGAYGSMIYALAHHQASGGIALAGLGCCVSDPDLASNVERLGNDVWVYAQLSDAYTDPLGWSLMRAKGGYVSPDGIWDTGDDKTVQQTTYFGLPWMRLYDASGKGAQAPSPPETTSNAGWSVSRLEGLEATYVMTATVDASTYALSQTVEGFDLIQVEGLDQAFGEDWPALPMANLDLLLPLSATVTSLTLTPEQPVDLDNLDIPSYALEHGPMAITATYTTTVGGPYAEKATYVTSPENTHQTVQVQVLPAAYDADADQATLYRDLEVAVQYESPQTLAITYFEPYQSMFIPGEPVGAASRLINAGDEAETVMATLVLQDLTGQIVGFEASPAFEVPPGGHYDLDIDLDGPLDGDLYALRLFVWQDGQVVTGTGRGITISAGELEGLTVPEELAPGEEGTFTVTYTNLGGGATIATVSLVVYDRYGVPVGWLEPQTVPVNGGSSATLTFHWTPSQTGTYLASAVAMAGRQEYGPLTRSLEVTGSSLYLPLVLRTYP